MGQGGYLNIINQTGCKLTLLHTHSYQMNAWDNSFPTEIAPLSQVVIYIEENDWCVTTDTAADAYYAVGGTGEQLNIGYNRSPDRCLFGAMNSISRQFCIRPGPVLGFVHDGHVFLTLCSGPCPQLQPVNWMSAIKDSYNLKELSIPGTHETCALYEPWIGMAKCQSLTLDEQLKEGVRFVDIRCAVSDENTSLLVFHGDKGTSVYQNLNFDQVLDMCESFLNAHPSETILMRLRNEHDDKDQQFALLFDKYVNSQVDTKTRRKDLFLDQKEKDKDVFPQLGACRNHIVLLRNFKLPQVGYNGIWGIEYAKDDLFTIQDHYQVASGSQKWQYVKTNLDLKTIGPKTAPFRINYTSGYVMGIGPDILAVSDYVNPRLYDYFNTAKDRAYGAILSDFMTAELAHLIYWTNQPLFSINMDIDNDSK